MENLAELERLRYVANELGISNPQIYPIQTLKIKIKQKEKENAIHQNSTYNRSQNIPRFQDIIGATEAKKAILHSIIYPIRRPELYNNLGWNRGILLFGPPGTGKTLLAHKASKEIDAEFIEKDSASIQSKWIGEAAQNVAKLFNQARESLKYYKSRRPVIIFIDEVDALFGKTNGSCDYDVELRNQFKKEMDSKEDKDDKLHLHLIAATNRPWNIDEAFLRRFQKRIYIKLPDFEERIQLLQLYTKQLNLVSSFSFIEISNFCAGYSGSDILDLCREVYQLTIDRLFESDNPNSNPLPITSDDFENILQQRNMSVSPEQINKFEEWAQNHQAL